MKNEAFANTCPLEYYLKAVDIIKDRVEDPVFYVFTDNPKSDTIRELVKSSHMHHFKIFTIDCEGCFLDYDNPRNSTNEYYFTQGGYINEPVKTPKELIFRSKPSNRGNY